MKGLTRVTGRVYLLRDEITKEFVCKSCKKFYRIRTYIKAVKVENLKQCYLCGKSAQT